MSPSRMISSNRSFSIPSPAQQSHFHACSSGPARVYRGALSTPPTNPKCRVLFVDTVGSAFLHRLKDGGGIGWLKDVGGIGWTRVAPLVERGICSVTACGGRFYVHYHNRGNLVGVIDPLIPQRPTVQFGLIWDLGRHSALETSRCCVVDNNGHACLVELLKLDHTVKLRVFRADLSRKRWVRVETLGDRAIIADSLVKNMMFHDWYCAFSFIAADVGLKKNTIYCSRYDNDGVCSWGAFDLDSQTWIDGTQLSYKNLEDAPRKPWENCWFLPTLDWIDTTQTS